MTKQDSATAEGAATATPVIAKDKGVVAKSKEVFLIRNRRCFKKTLEQIVQAERPASFAEACHSVGRPIGFVATVPKRGAFLRRSRVDKKRKPYVSL